MDVGDRVGLGLEEVLYLALLVHLHLLGWHLLYGKFFLDFVFDLIWTLALVALRHWDLLFVTL